MRRRRGTLALDVAVVRLIEGLRLECSVPGRPTLVLGRSDVGRRDPYFCEHPGGRTYHEDPREAAAFVVAHLGVQALEEARIA